MKGNPLDRNGDPDSETAHRNGNEIWIQTRGSLPCVPLYMLIALPVHTLGITGSITGNKLVLREERPD